MCGASLVASCSPQIFEVFNLPKLSLSLMASCSPQIFEVWSDFRDLESKEVYLGPINLFFIILCLF